MRRASSAVETSLWAIIARLGDGADRIGERFADDVALVDPGIAAQCDMYSVPSSPLAMRVARAMSRSQWRAPA
jgi:hypothetical protein